MTFHAEFTYTADQRERLLRFLQSDALKSQSEIRFKGVWIAAHTGTGYAIIETDSAAALYTISSQWADYGRLMIVPVVAASEI